MAAKTCFKKVVKQCSRFTRSTGKSYHKCMSGALKRQCYGKGKRGKRKCKWGHLGGDRKARCRKRPAGKRWRSAGRSGGKTLY